MVAKFALDMMVNVVLICYSRYQISELCHVSTFIAICMLWQRSHIHIMATHR